MGRCEAFYHLQQFQEAIASCELALKIEENWENTSPQRAWFFRGEPFQINALYNKSLALMSLQEYEQAIKTLSELLKINPKHPQAEKLLKNLQSR